MIELFFWDYVRGNHDLAYLNHAGFNMFQIIMHPILEVILLAKYTATPCGCPIGRKVFLHVEPLDILTHVEQQTPNKQISLSHRPSRIKLQASLG